MTMKKWRFFPILVKEKIVAYMFIPDIISFAKCSKNCENLLTFAPIHLPFAIIDESSQVARRTKLIRNHLISLAEFSIFATSRKFYVTRLEIITRTEKNNKDVKVFTENMKGSRKLLKVKEMSMNIRSEHSALFTEILGICDHSCIESIEIPELFFQVVYNEIVKTPHWKNSKRVSLNNMCHQRLSMPNVNIDDFLHFESVQLSIERLDTDDAIKLVQNLRNASDHAKFNISCQEPMQHDLVRQKIEAGWAGNWQENQQTNTRFVIDPTKPGHVFEFNCSPYSLNGGWSLLEKFNRRQELFGRALARN